MTTTTFLPSPVYRADTGHKKRSMNKHSDTNPRFTKRFQWAARLTLLIIAFVWYSPSVHAVVEEVNKPPILNRIEGFYPLGAELEKLRDDLLQAKRSLATAAATSDWYTELEQTLSERKAAIEKQDKKQREQNAATLQQFKDHELSDEVINRQLSANQMHDTTMEALLGELNSALDAIDLVRTANNENLEVLSSQIDAALSFVRQPFSNVPRRHSSNLDFVSDPVRDIYTTQTQIDNLVGTDAGNYTATDSATLATQAIIDKVTELGSDPLTLYNWVHDTVRWLPSYGVMQGADYTLQAEQGNAFDTASLLIALLREAGHEARYRYGIVRAPVDQVRNWVGDVKNADAATNLMSQGGIPQIKFSYYGGAIDEIKFEHVWVEVKQGTTWYPMDPSFKQYSYTEGMDLQAAVPFDAQGLLTQLESSSMSNESEGWSQGIDATLIETELTNYQTQLETYLTTNAPQATLGDVLGRQSIIPSAAATLEAAAPNYIIGFNAAADQLPDTLFHRFQFQLFDTALGPNDFVIDQELFTLNELTTNLVGKNIALSFRPETQADEEIIAGYLPEVINGPEDVPDTLLANVDMIGELTIDGQVVQSTGPILLGAALKTRLGFDTPLGGYTFTENFLDAGQYQALGIDMQGVSPAQLQALEARLQNTQNQIEANDTTSLTKHDVVGDILQAGIQGYMAMTYATDKVAAQTAGVAYYRQPSYGTFSTALSVAYIAGVPTSVTFSGVVMDVDRLSSNVEEKANCYEGFVAFNRASGMRNSAYEHQIPEQLYSTDTVQAEGVSTTKALTIAMAGGQRIYTLTTIDQLNNSPINLDANAREEIESALGLGLEVTVHAAPITVNGWQGSGYAIVDPENGLGVYQISGGLSGGFLTVNDAVLDAVGALNSILTLYTTGAAALLDQLNDAEYLKVRNVLRTAGRFLGMAGTALDVFDLLLKGCNIAVIASFITFTVFVSTLALGFGAALAGPIGGFIVGNLVSYGVQRFTAMLAEEAC